MGDVTHRKRGLKFEKKQWVVFLPPKKKVDFRGSPRPCGGCRAWWVRWKSQHKKIVHLSPHVEKPFNLKAIKIFVPELKSNVFLCFRDSYVIYVWVMNILCTFHTSVYYGYITGVLLIPQSSSITGVSSSDFLMSYPKHCFMGSTVLKRHSQCIIQPQPNGRTNFKDPIYPTYLPNPSAQAGYDTKSIFKWSLAGLNSEFSFS